MTEVCLGQCIDVFGIYVEMHYNEIKQKRDVLMDRGMDLWQSGHSKMLTFNSTTAFNSTM